ncbi:MAG: hypothetical protein WCL00_00845 [Bacteroidota bacterium]
MAAQTETAKAEVILNGTKANATLKELENAAKALNAELRKMPVNSQEFTDKAKKLQEVNTRLAEIRQETKALGDDLKKTSGGFQGMFDSLKGAAVGAGAAMAAAFSLKHIGEYFKEGIQKAFELRDAEKLLLDVLDGNKASQRELIGLAKERSGTTKDSRLEIEQAEKFLVIQGRTPEQIRKTILAAQDLAVVTGQTLLNSVEDLDGTMEGRLSKGLQKLSSQFKDLSKEQLYHGDAIDIVARKYKGLAQEEMQTTEGRLILLSKGWKALQRTIGEALLGSNSWFDGMIKGATDALNATKKLFEVPLAQKYQEEQQSLNALVFQIQATNTNQAERNRLVEELRKKYPEFIGNLKNEDVTNQFLAKHLEEVNFQYMEKIRLAQSEDKLKDIAEAQSKASKKLSEAEADRNNILAKSMDLLYQSKPAYAALVEHATSLEEKIRLVKKYWGEGGGTTGTASAFLEAAEKAKQAADKMKVYGVQFKTEQLQIAEEAVNSSLNLNNTLDLVSNQILSIAVQTKDKNLQMIIQSELDDRERTHKMVEDHKIVFKEETQWKKMTIDQLNDYISKGREADATNTDRTNMRKATDELNSRGKLNDKLKESYKSLMESLKEIEGKNYADKLSQTQQEIRNVEDKYNTLIEKALKFKADNEKSLSPQQKKGISDNVSSLEVARDSQVKQVLTQAEQKFADDVKKIHENLRVARMSITARQVYEVNKKYDDARKEILDAIDFAYNQEVIAANGNAQKIIQAEKNKAAALKAIQKDLDNLKKAQKSEVSDAKEQGNLKFDEALNSLKLKAEKDLATGKERIQLDVDAKYKKILDDNIKDETKVAEIKKQMAEEVAAKQVELASETAKKTADKAISLAKGAVDALGSIFSMQNDSENAALKKDEAANNKKKDNLKKQLDAKIISKSQYDSMVNKMDLDLDKKKKKIEHDQAVRAKEMALFNAIIGVALAVAKALGGGPVIGIVMSVITAALGAIQIGYILSQKVPEAASGRYSVIGQNDNKLYKDVPMVSSPETGLYSSPTLISETGSEIVIDPKTTKNLMVNYPQVIDAINFARVPQRSSGKYIDSATAIPGGTAPVSDPALMTSINKLNSLIEGGIPAFISFDHLRETTNRINQIEAEVSK